MKLVTPVLGDFQVMKQPELPTVSFKALVEQNALLCQEHDMDALRYLSAGGPDKKRARTGMAWNPSSLDGCNLKAVYKACRVKRDPVITSSATQFVFDRGTVIGLWMAAYIRSLEDFGIVADVQAQVSDRQELLLTDSGLDYGGFSDIRFTYVPDGRRYLSEVKSKDNDKAMARITSPDKKHERQFNDYLVMDQTDAGWVVYVGLSDDGDQQTFTIKEFPRVINHSKWSDTTRSIASLQRFRERPDRMPPRSDNPRFECPSCPYQLKCKRNLTPAQAMQES